MPAGIGGTVPERLLARCEPTVKIRQTRAETNDPSEAFRDGPRVFSLSLGELDDRSPGNFLAVTRF
jgi:hypothetical protein